MQLHSSFQKSTSKRHASRPEKFIKGLEIKDQKIACLGWWFFSTHLKKNAQVKLDHFPKKSG